MFGWKSQQGYSFPVSFHEIYLSSARCARIRKCFVGKRSEGSDRRERPRIVSERIHLLEAIADPATCLEKSCMQLPACPSIRVFIPQASVPTKDLFSVIFQQEFHIVCWKRSHAMVRPIEPPLKFYKNFPKSKGGPLPQKKLSTKV